MNGPKDLRWVVGLQLMPGVILYARKAQELNLGAKQEEIRRSQDERGLASRRGKTHHELLPDDVT